MRKKQLRQEKKKHRTADKEEKKLENNMKELNLNEMEMVNGGLDFFGSLAKVTAGMINDIKNPATTLYRMSKSFFCGDD